MCNERAEVKCRQQERPSLSLPLVVLFELRVQNVCESAADTILLFSFIIHVLESIFKYTVVLRSMHPYSLSLSLSLSFLSRGLVVFSLLVSAPKHPASPSATSIQLRTFSFKAIRFTKNFLRIKFYKLYHTKYFTAFAHFC